MPSKILFAALALVAALGLGAGIYLTGQGPSAASPEEKAAITASNGLVKRDKGALTLTLPGGEALALVDRDSCGDLPCPKTLGATVRYKGWDEALGGYRLTLDGKEMILAYGDDGVMQEASHADPPSEGPMPLPAPPPARPAMDDSVAQWLTEIAQTRDADEAKAVAAAKGKAERQGSRLILGLDGGKHLVLEDSLACGQAACPAPLFRAFAYAGLSPDGRQHLVEERRAEETTRLRINLADGAVQSAP